MGVINIVKSYPELFGKAGETIDEEDAWRKIASVQNNGSYIEKISFTVYNQFNAVCNLFHLGLRDEAVELAMEVLKYAEKYQYFAIAQQLYKRLIEDSFLQQDVISVHKYNLLYRKYSDVVELEYQAQLMYGELNYNHNRGLESNEIEIIRGLNQIEEKLPFDSLTYHYYYHSCQLILASENEYEGKLQNAIKYFESLFYNHNSYLSSFVIKLVLHYQKNGNYKEAEVLLSSHLKRCKEGSTMWFKYMKTTCLLYLSAGEMIKAKNCSNVVVESEKFQNLSERDRAEWIQFQNAT